jgi:hypothetical protein
MCPLRLFEVDVEPGSSTVVHHRRSLEGGTDKHQRVLCTALRVTQNARSIAYYIRGFCEHLCNALLVRADCT